MAGSSIFDYVHHQDHLELADQLGLCLPQSEFSSSSFCQGLDIVSVHYVFQLMFSLREISIHLVSLQREQVQLC